MPAQLRQFLNLLPSSEDDSRFSKDLPLEVNFIERYSNRELTPLYVVLSHRSMERPLHRRGCQRDYQLWSNHCR